MTSTQEDDLAKIKEYLFVQLEGDPRAPLLPWNRRKRAELDGMTLTALLDANKHGGQRRFVQNNPRPVAIGVVFPCLPTVRPFMDEVPS